MRAVNQRDFMQAYAGAVPELIKTDVGIFVPGTPLASTDGVEVTRGDKDIEQLKKDRDGVVFVKFETERESG